MELWIRSQDKETLLKCNIIAIIPNIEDGSYKIINYFEDGHYIILGYYISKTRALEILDEIQDELISSDFMPIEKNEEVVLTCGSARIYEMPED